MLRTSGVGSAFFLALVLGLAPPAKADPVNGTLYFTTFNGGPNVNRVDFDYDGLNTFTLSPITNIASTPGADGIIFAPNDNLLVGGQGTGLVHQVNTTTGAFTSAATGQGGAFHLTLDPSGNSVWSAGLPGLLSQTSLTPFGPAGTAHALNGSDTTITHVAFTPGGRTFYINDTGNGGDGDGNFGIINLTTFTTTRLISNLDGAHGMAYDSFTGDLFVFGHDRIIQMDLSGAAPTIVRNLEFAGLGFDQGTVDGHGHLFVASNEGHLFFMDYSSDGLISNAHFHATPFLANFLDDIAPLSGLGSQEPPAGVPLPGVAVAGLALLGGLGGRKALARVRRQAA
jgi:hypothetical protein